MTQELLLLRHAKSDWHGDVRLDHERPLNARGRRAAPRMGAFIRDQNLIPDQVLCSTAVRTRQTLDGLLSQWPSSSELSTEYCDGVYEAGLATLLREIEPRLHRSKRLLLVGHNPGMELLLRHLVGPEPLHGLSKYPTCALSQLSLTENSLAAGSAQLCSLQFVRQLPEIVE